MDPGSDPRQLLARKLRSLREDRWPEIKVTQSQLSRALGADRPVSVPLISSWESLTNPKIPPIPRLEAYAAFFATIRSITGPVPRMLDAGELTRAETAERDELIKELLRLRSQALRVPDTMAVDDVIQSLNIGYWYFADGRPVTIVCAQLPDEMREKIPYSKPTDPDHVALYAYADLDSLIELFGHIRAANPGSQVNFRMASQLAPDDYTTHLISLGGVDWNLATRSLFGQLALPVRQVADWRSPDGPYFEVSDVGRTRKFRPQLATVNGTKVLQEDVALFARSVNPFNRKRTASICNGMYASGTYGAVRALTDARFRDRNAEYARARFGRSENFCILTKVKVENGTPLTPDWTLSETRLFEWESES
jgi:hypothetical protein